MPLMLSEMKNLSQEEQKALFLKLKTIRGVAKNANYGAQYGAGPPKIARTAGIQVSEAQKLHKAYWSDNWAIKKVSSEMRVKTIDGQQWLYNPVSKFWYSLRAVKDIFSTLAQGTGVFCFDTWVMTIVTKRPQLTGQFHDEIILSVLKNKREEVRKFLRECIEETNSLLKLNRELDIGIEFGSNYGDIH